MARTNFPRHRDEDLRQLPKRRVWSVPRLPSALSKPSRVSVVFTFLVGAVALGMVLVIASVGGGSGSAARDAAASRPIPFGRPPASDAPPATATVIGMPATATAGAGAGAGTGAGASAGGGVGATAAAPPPFPKAGKAGSQPAKSAAAGAGPYASRYQGRITTCGTKLCGGTENWHFYGASVYNDYDRPDDTAALAISAKLDVLRLTDFIDTGGSLSEATSESQWRVVDAMVAAADRAGLRVELDLSVYRNLLQARGINPYTYDWKPFLSFVTDRVNTVSGHRYRNDPTIAVIALAGNAAPADGVSSSQINSFFTRTLAQLKQLDPSVIRASGSVAAASGSGTDWRTIVADPDNQVCQVRIYSSADRSAAQSVARYCTDRHKPWMVEEFGFDQNVSDATRAQDFQSVLALVRQYGGAGTGFWNLGFQVIGQNGNKDTYDVNSSTPQTFHVIQQNAP